jgi:hypothetical protein
VGEALPFADAMLRAFHYEKHRNEFTFANAVEYEAAADAFMAAQIKPPVRECVRNAGDRVRFNRKTGDLVVQASGGTLRTYHRPSQKFVRLGYFRWECGRTEV